MPNILKLMSPISVLIGLVGAGLALALMWPFEPKVGVTIGAFAFVLTAGIAELVRRMVVKRAAPAAPAKDTPDGR